MEDLSELLGELVEDLGHREGALPRKDAIAHLSGVSAASTCLSTRKSARLLQYQPVSHFAHRWPLNSLVMQALLRLYHRLSASLASQPFKQ